MLTLYVKSSCPFCIRVKNHLNTAEIEYTEKDINESDEYRDELLDQGGKQQVPFLVDSEAGVSMYESADIVEYVLNKYKKDHADTGD